MHNTWYGELAWQVEMTEFCAELEARSKFQWRQMVEAHVEYLKTVQMVHHLLGQRWEVVGVQVEYLQLPVPHEQVLLKVGQVVPPESQDFQFVHGIEDAHLHVEDSVVL